MKRRDFIRHLERHGCEFLREGGNHTVYVKKKQYQRQLRINAVRGAFAKLAKTVGSDIKTGVLGCLGIIIWSF